MPIQQRPWYWLRAICDKCPARDSFMCETRGECLRELEALGWLITDSRVLCRACREKERP